MPVVNMEGVPVGFQPMPDTDGVIAKFTGYLNSKTKNGDDSIRLEFTVDEPEEHAGHKLFLNQTVIPSGPKANLHFLKETLVLMGAEPEEVESPTLDTDKVLDKLLTGEVKMNVGHREWNNRIYNDVTLLPNDSW